MKITAEFNSNEELLSFISTFGTKTVTPIQEFKAQGIIPKPIEKQQKTKAAPKLTEKVEDKPKAAEPTKEPEKAEQPKEPEKIEVTKEMVRAVFTKLIKAGKQKDAKELTKKYGASRLPDIKKEDFEAVYKEAEELI